jgi:hypothetical protein
MKMKGSETTEVTTILGMKLLLEHKYSENWGYLYLNFKLEFAVSLGVHSGIVTEVLCYKLEGCGFKTW